MLKSTRADEVSVAIARAFVAMRTQLASVDKHPVVKEIIERLEGLEAGSQEQEDFNQGLMECLAEMRPILDAVEKKLAGE